MKKWVLMTAFLVLLGMVGILTWPGNYYVRQALIHRNPRIDQYTIFENRLVKAGNPTPWAVSENYNESTIPEHLLPLFERYGTVAFVVIKDNQLLFETYWDDYSTHSHSNSFSMAKSIVSLAVGCAIDDGFIQRVDQPVKDFLPEFGGFDGKTLTIRHLLTMSAGVDFQEAYSSPFSPTTELYYGNNLKAVTYGMKEIEEPGVRFIYQSGVTQLLAFVLEKATGERLAEYVSRKLWTPMGAEEHALWSLDRLDGMEKAYCCFNSNARDFARFGQLILNKGRWGNRQLVSETYIEEATTPDTSLVFADHNQVNQVYGYQFWSLEYNQMRIPYMRGILGQYVFVLPEENAVIVRLGQKRSETRTSQFYPDDIDIWLEAGLSIIHANVNTNHSAL